MSELVRESEIVITATSAREPLVFPEDLHPGLHITAMGSDGPGKQELHPGVLLRADRIACDSRSQCFHLGELQHGLRDGAPITELGELTAGSKPGRGAEGEVTVCDLTGVGVQDTAIAVLTYQRARAKGLGTAVEA